MQPTDSTSTKGLKLFFSVFPCSSGVSGQLVLLVEWLIGYRLTFCFFVKLSVGKKGEKQKEGIEKNLPVESFESVKCPGEQLNYFSFILNCEKYVRMCARTEKKSREPETLQDDDDSRTMSETQTNTTVNTNTSTNGKRLQQSQCTQTHDESVLQFAVKFARCIFK